MTPHVGLEPTTNLARMVAGLGASDFATLRAGNGQRAGKTSNPLGHIEG